MHLRTFKSVLHRGHGIGGASRRDLGLSCGIIIHDTVLGALNGFGLFGQLGPDQRHRNQQRPHSLITHRFRARAAVGSLLSAFGSQNESTDSPESRKGTKRRRSLRLVRQFGSSNEKLPSKSVRRYVPKNPLVMRFVQC